MEYKEYYSGRWVMFSAGLFWGLLLPFAYAIMFKALMQQSVGMIIIISACMLILEIASIRAFEAGIAGFIANGKKHLILGDDSLQIIMNIGYDKGKIYNINYANIEGFCFSSNGTKRDKISGKYYVKENASGSIHFNVGKKDYSAYIYNALSAAQFILEKLKDEQIDVSSNELDKEGNHMPKG